MSNKLEQAVEEARKLPENRQDEVADVLLGMTADAPEYTPEIIAAIDEGIADADAGRFVPAEAVEKLFKPFRRV